MLAGMMARSVASSVPEAESVIDGTFGWRIGWMFHGRTS